MTGRAAQRSRSRSPPPPPAPGGGGPMRQSQHAARRGAAAEREHSLRADTCRAAVLMLTSGALSAAAYSLGSAPWYHSV